MVVFEILLVMMLEEFFESHDGSNDQSEFGNDKGLNGKQCNAGKSQNPPSNLTGNQK